MVRRNEILEAVLTVKTLRDALQAFPREEVAEVFDIPEEYLAAFIGETHKKYLIFDAEIMGEIKTLMLFGSGSGGAHNVKPFRSRLVEYIKQDVVGYCDTLIDNNKKKWKAIKIGQQSAIQPTTGSHP